MSVVRAEADRVKALIFGVILSWENWQRSERDARQVVIDHPAPSMPERFGSVEELAEYNLKKAEHDNTRLQFELQASEFAHRYEEAAEQLMDTLPIGSTIYFKVEDFMTRGGLMGSQYNVSHVDADDELRIEVEKLTG